MRVILQGNKSVSGEYWVDIDQFVFCNDGGKPNMSFADRNIPPILSGSVPTEVWAKKNSDPSFSQMAQFDSAGLIDTDNTVDQKIFRFLMIYDTFDTIYNPEFKLLERPYFYLLENVTAGEDTFTLDKLDPNAVRFISYAAINDILSFNEEETHLILNITESDDYWYVRVDNPITGNYNLNTIVTNKSKFVTKGESDILDATTGTYEFSPFKMRFIDENELTNRQPEYVIDYTSGHEFDTVAIPNDDFTTVFDLFGTDKIAVCSSYSFSVSAIALAGDIFAATTGIQISGGGSQMSIGDYLTLEEAGSYEIIKVIDIVSDTSITAERGMFGTTAIGFTAVGCDITLPQSAYAALLLYPGTITDRYKLYKHIDFQLTYI